MHKINIVIPIAGKGKKFEESGSIFPKALVEVKAKPMIQVVVENISLSKKYDQRFIFIVNKRDHQKFAIAQVLELLAPGCKVIVVESDTKGSACSVLLASEYIDNDVPLLIANGDQYLDMDMNSFVGDAESRNLDGSLIVFDSIHPRWSFVKTDEGGYVIEAAEKRPISRNATAGVYYYKKGSFFIEAVKEMIRKEATVMEQYFVCPTYNEMILKGMKIGVFEIESDKMYGLGTPEQVKEFETIKLKGA
ncbi:MAG: glycosyltransferase family 2 protein [Candidatus Omnitrophica bacterium]|nr:glycosyltransferase family 2 protein [Candidatus Omnitrophota bacterium]